MKSAAELKRAEEHLQALWQKVLSTDFPRSRDAYVSEIAFRVGLELVLSFLRWARDDKPGGPFREFMEAMDAMENARNPVN